MAISAQRPLGSTSKLETLPTGHSALTSVDVPSSRSIHASLMAAALEALGVLADHGETTRHAGIGYHVGDTKAAAHYRRGRHRDGGQRDPGATSASVRPMPHTEAGTK